MLTHLSSKAALGISIDPQMERIWIAIKRYLYDRYPDHYVETYDESYDGFYYESYDDLGNDSTYNLIQLLLHVGAEVNPSNGELPLSAAAKFGDIDLVALLIRAGADVNATDENGFGPLSKAVRSNYIDDRDMVAIAHQLLDAGADVNARPYRLYERDEFDEDESMIDLLLQHGASVSAHSLISAIQNIAWEKNTASSSGSWSRKYARTGGKSGRGGGGDDSSASTYC
jgi:ankyrin repeat protein